MILNNGILFWATLYVSGLNVLGGT